MAHLPVIVNVVDVVLFFSEHSSSTTNKKNDIYIYIYIYNIRCHCHNYCRIIFLFHCMCRRRRRRLGLSLSDSLRGIITTSFVAIVSVSRLHLIVCSVIIYSYQTTSLCRWMESSLINSSHIDLT